MLIVVSSTMSDASWGRPAKLPCEDRTKDPAAVEFVFAATLFHLGMRMARNGVLHVGHDLIVKSYLIDDYAYNFRAVLPEGVESDLVMDGALFDELVKLPLDDGINAEVNLSFNDNVSVSVGNLMLVIL